METRNVQRRDQKKSWYKKNIARLTVERRTYQHKRYERLRQAVLAFYGNKCSRCSFNDSRALQLDHIFGGGTKEHCLHGTDTTYNRALKFSHEYQLLCANCNWIKRVENKETKPRLESCDA